MHIDRVPTGFAINSQTVYDDDALRLGLGLSHGALEAARKSGRLRHTREGARTFYLGAWVLAWIEAGAVGVQLLAKGDVHEQQ
jgi:hypothetical protein